MKPIERGEAFAPALDAPISEPIFVGHEEGSGCRYWDGAVCGQPASYEIVWSYAGSGRPARDSAVCGEPASYEIVWSYAPGSSYVCTEHVAHVRATFLSEAINRIRDIPGNTR